MKYPLIILLLFTFTVIAQSAETKNYISGSLYYTGSTASHDRSSGAVSGYLSATIGTYHYLTAGYDNVNIEQTDWKYKQKMYIAGGGLSLYPFYIKGHFGKINGNFTGTSYEFNYKDKTNLYNLDFMLYTDYLLYRASFVLEEVTENINLTVRQYGVGAERYFGTHFYLSLIGYLSDLSDNRELYSLKTKLSYFPSTSLTLSFETFFGQRAFFFNPDLLTIYNLGPTQKNLYSLRVDYFLGGLTFVANFQYTDFEEHAARYYVAGIKYTLAY